MHCKDQAFKVPGFALLCDRNIYGGVGIGTNQRLYSVSDINEFKHFKRWFEEVGNRPAVKRGMEVGNNLRVNPSTLTAEERVQMRNIMYNQRAIPAPA